MRKPYQDTTVWFKLFISVHPFPTTQLHRARLSYTCHVHTISGQLFQNSESFVALGNPDGAVFRCLCCIPTFVSAASLVSKKVNDISDIVRMTSTKWKVQCTLMLLTQWRLLGGANQRVADHFWAVEVLCAPEG